MTGRRSQSEPLATFEMTVSTEQVERFFEAVAWQLPERPAAPPTLATIFRQGEFEALKTMGVAMHKILHGEQKYRFLKDLAPGQPVRGTTFLNSEFEKTGGKGGAMKFYVVQTNLADASGETCVECVSTIIARGLK